MKKILIIDDYKEIRDLFEESLKKEGYEVETVESAELGACKILHGGYDLILLDLLMPRKDGIWVLDQIREKKPEKANGKIVIMGISNDAEDHKTLIDEAQNKGASDFLDKRVSIDREFTAKIKEYLKKDGK